MHNNAILATVMLAAKGYLLPAHAFHAAMEGLRGIRYGVNGDVLIMMIAIIRLFAIVYSFVP